jgi:hypothetical protein
VTDRLDPAEPQDHPVASGLVALVAVAVVVGVVAGLAALIGARAAGLDDSEPTAQQSGGASLFLPRPEPTRGEAGPLITLAPGEETGAPRDETEPEDEESSESPAAKRISLQVGQPSVAPMEQIDLTGVYPGGEGAILQVQRFEGGSWQDFPVTVSVSDQTFSTYVQTGQGGVNRFRVVDTDSGKPSNEVKVTIG